MLEKGFKYNIKLSICQLQNDKCLQLMVKLDYGIKQWIN